jgi:hypothetical protein
MPSYIQLFGADESSCVEKLNHAVQLFNNKLQKVIAKLNANLPVKFTYINSYEIDSENYTDLGNIFILLGGLMVDHQDRRRHGLLILLCRFQNHR